MTLRMYRRPLIAAALFAAMLGVGACEQADKITSSAPPSYSLDRDYAASVPVKRLVKYRHGVRGNFAWAVISGRGGRISVGNNSIVIPRKAVDQPTIFTMQVIGGDTAVVQLHATRLVGGQPYGRFDKPVTLYMDYSDAEQGDSSHLVITYLVDGTTSGAKQGLPSARHADQTLSAQLNHFSNYALGEN